MKTIKYSIIIIRNNIKLFVKRIFGTKIVFKNPLILENKVLIKTKGKKALIKIGKKSCIRNYSELSSSNGVIDVGDNVFINKNATIVAHELIKIGCHTTIGPNCCIYDHDHDGKGGFKTNAIHIGKNVWIGANCTILKGVSIGDNSIIAAGSIVYQDVSSNMMFYQKKEAIQKNI